MVTQNEEPSDGTSLGSRWKQRTSDNLEQRVRVCRSCESGNHRKFNAELAIHFPGLKCPNKPIVWVFQCFCTCLDYGFTEFAIPRPSYNSYGKARTTEGMRPVASISSRCGITERFLRRMCSLMSQLGR